MTVSYAPCGKKFLAGVLWCAALAGGCEWGEAAAELRVVIPDDPQTLDPGEITVTRSPMGVASFM